MRKYKNKKIIEILNIINFITYELHVISFQNSMPRFSHVQCSIKPMYVDTVCVPKNSNTIILQAAIICFSLEITIALNLFTHVLDIP